MQRNMRMYCLTIQSTLVIVLYILSGAHSYRWLGIAKDSVKALKVTGLHSFLCPSSRNGRKNRLLNKAQKRLCRKRPELMKYVVAAAEYAKTECLKQAKYQRWNCEAINKAPRFSGDLRDGTREAAFVDALSSAALVFAITQNCLNDKTCQCGRKPSKALLRRIRRARSGQRLKFARCHDNIAYAIRFANSFLHPRGKRPDRVLLKLHNYKLGQTLVRNSMIIRCECSGLKPSCSVETCTRILPFDFSKIASKLFMLYKEAEQVVLRPIGENKQGLVLKSNIKNGRKKKRKSNKMIYLQKSRDFCIASKGKKLLGTQGRECARSLKGDLSKLKVIDTTAVDNCKHLCCGRGHIKRSRVVRKKCSCKFKWKRMDVVCKQCDVVEQIRTCK